MGVRMSDDEAWQMLRDSHTGILTTLRRDGMPITLPIWFVVLDRSICFAAPSKTKKVARLRHDPRASFLVETGERWAELQAAHCTGRVEIVDDLALIERIDRALDDKYLAFRTQRTAMPSETQRHYAGRTFLRLVPDERMLTWDNRRIPLGGS